MTQSTIERGGISLLSPLGDRISVAFAGERRQTPRPVAILFCNRLRHPGASGSDETPDLSPHAIVATRRRGETPDHGHAGGFAQQKSQSSRNR